MSKIENILNILSKKVDRGYKLSIIEIIPGDAEQAPVISNVLIDQIGITSVERSNTGSIMIRSTKNPFKENKIHCFSNSVGTGGEIIMLYRISDNAITFNTRLIRSHTNEGSTVVTNETEAFDYTNFKYIVEIKVFK